MQHLSLITGIVHCGSTLLLDMLKVNDDVYSDFEIGILSADSLSVQGLTQWCRDDPHFKMLNERYNITRNEIIALHTSKNWHEVYHRLYQLIQARDPKSRMRTHLIDKTPGYALLLEQVISRVPGCAMVGLVRDPRAVYASWLKRPTRKVTPQEFMKTYNQSIGALQNANAQMASVYIARFEHLITNPQTQLSMICAHLGLTFKPEMCDPRKAFSQNHKTKNQFRPPGTHGPARDVNDSGIDMSALREYRTILSDQDQLIIVENLALPLSWTLYRG